MQAIGANIYNNLTPSVIVIAMVVISALLVTVILARISVLDKRAIWAVLAIFVVYLGGFLYVTLLSREPAGRSTIVLSPLAGYKQSMRFNPGFLDFLKLIWHKRFAESINTIEITSVARFEEILLNILLFVPFGFLLPTMAKCFRKMIVTGLLGFAVSILIETVQFFTGLGIFDADDLLNNTIGALAGYILFFFCIKYFVRERKVKVRQDNAAPVRENDHWDDVVMPEHVGRKYHQRYIKS
ncbi:MAG: VanZ family protein [Clostridiales bacterium]|nr:VanZ family protein [Clostridiales bacterium]